jgi:hypothetical protein
VNTVLDGSYRIMDVVGFGGFGVTYQAEDTNLRTLVAIKEYYPFEFGDRDRTMSVRPKSDRHKRTFEWGRSNFLEEARTLARFEHPSIVRVARVFEANSTAYMVMRFEQGQSFEAWLQGLGRRPTQEELDAIVAPLLDALQMMHAENFLHRDIAPDNIIIRTDGTPVLLDFGAARRAVAEMSRTLTGIVKAGYSPHEQYSSDGRLQGPWSDIYALGGTLYRAVTGKPPEEATLRFDEDRMVPAAQAAKGRYRPGFLRAIDVCLNVRHAQRPRSVAELRPMLFGEGMQQRTGTQRLASTHFAANSRSSASTSAGRFATKMWLAIAAALVLFVGVFGGFEYVRWEAEQRLKLEADAKRQQEERRAAEKKANEDQAAAEAKRQADATAAIRRAAQERAARDLEAKRQADAAVAKRQLEEAAPVSITDTVFRWGLIGTWRLNCSAPASRSDGELKYVIRGGKLFHDREFGDARDSSPVMSATSKADGSLELVVKFDSLSQTRQFSFIKGGDGRIRAISNRNVANNEYTIKDGKFTSNGNPPPWQTRCY